MNNEQTEKETAEEIISIVNHLRTTYRSEYALEENAYGQACDDVLNVFKQWQSTQQKQDEVFFKNSSPTVVNRVQTICKDHSWISVAYSDTFKTCFYQQCQNCGITKPEGETPIPNKQLTEQEQPCPDCGGEGTYVDYIAACCQNQDEYFSCCNNPIREPVQVQCERCQASGYIKKEQPKEQLSKYDELVKFITHLNEKYDEDGYDCSPIIKLQRLEQCFNSALKFYKNKSDKKEQLYTREQVESFAKILSFGDVAGAEDYLNSLNK